MPRLPNHYLIAKLLLLPIALALGCDSKSPVTNESDSKTVDSKETSKPATAQTYFRFTDITKAIGLDSVYKNGQEAKQYTILESLGGGVGVIDFDRDGRQDLFFPGGGSFGDRTTIGLPSKLFHNIDCEERLTLQRPPAATRYTTTLTARALPTTIQMDFGRIGNSLRRPSTVAQPR